jgi:hypothetical protein
MSQPVQYEQQQVKQALFQLIVNTHLSTYIKRKVPEETVFCPGFALQVSQYF